MELRGEIREGKARVVLIADSAALVRKTVSGGAAVQF